MFTCEVNNVKVYAENFEPSIDSIRSYIKMAENDCDNNIKELRLKKSEGIIDMEYLAEDVPFERTRRVTGYLSNVKNFNDSKQAELKDRVKHTE